MIAVVQLSCSELENIVGQFVTCTIALYHAFVLPLSWEIYAVTR